MALFDPRLQSWEEHYAGSAQLGIILGKTACGRGTVSRLQMNDSGTIDIRRLLIRLGLLDEAK